MSNNENNLILELDEISRLWNEIKYIDHVDIDNLKYERANEKNKITQKMVPNIQKRLIDFKNEQLKELPTWTPIKMFRDFPTNIPSHWIDMYFKPETNKEKLISSLSSPETKEECYNAFRKYEKQFVVILRACEEKREEEVARFNAELEAIDKKYEKQTKELEAKKSELLEKLHQHTIIHEDLFDIASKISYILRQKRADSLKEAINLALSEKRQEENEEARREEAAKREKILEQQAYENRKHNEAMQRAAEEEARAIREHNAAMERAAREHNAAMERVAQDQAREIQKQTQMSRQQSNAASSAARARCNACANSGKCNVKFGPGAIGCPSFRPR